MSATAGSGKLYDAMKKLREQFDATAETWRDQVRQDFEERRLIPLELQVADTMRAMGRLGEVLSRVRRECS